MSKGYQKDKMQMREVTPTFLHQPKRPVRGGKRCGFWAMVKTTHARVFEERRKLDARKKGGSTQKLTPKRPKGKKSIPKKNRQKGRRSTWKASQNRFLPRMRGERT